MNTRKKAANTVDLVLNILIILSTIAAVSAYYVGNPDALGSVKNNCFNYFTTDSNILIAIASFVMLIYNIAKIAQPECTVPKWVTLLKYAGTAAVAQTMLTVVFFLAPESAIKSGLAGYLLLFRDNSFALHLSTPLLAVISFLLFERDNELTLGDSIIACLPSFIYSIFYLIFVVFIKRWTDWYGFIIGGKTSMVPLSLAVMYLAIFVIATVLRKLRRIR